MREYLDAPEEASARVTRTNAAGRLLAVLDAFGPEQRALSLSEIARRAGLSLSTAHRLVCELAKWGALERDQNGRYSIGLRMLELAALCPRGLGLREAAFPYLDELDDIMLMSIRPGWAGQESNPEIYPRLAAVRAEVDRRGLATAVEIDGGVKLHNAQRAVDAGATVLVAASEVFRTADPAAAARALAAIARGEAA